ncbi:fatty acyl-AMP ligase [Chitinimonas lacunae]|uniref:Fatty acyl-AMP ligase n=1 Tax=Chitinimonas lacunae TaxID=1963018 RepID=A0ABV8MT33_9NEIS
MSVDYLSIAHGLSRHAELKPHSIIYRLLENGESETARRTFAELDQRAGCIAGWLRERGYVRQRVMLLLSNPLLFVEAFLGCLYAAAIPVPVAVSRQRVSATLEEIARDAGICCVLSSEKEVLCRPDNHSALGTVPWYELETIEGDWLAPQAHSDDIAFIQYTSGSTGSPKGVVVSHRNILANEAMIAAGMRLDARSRIIGWLPHYHDMGLIGNILQPLYLGAECLLMPPASFIQKPLRWLRAISDHHGSVSGGPDFAYRLCVDKISAEQAAELDLSCWQVAFSGAEPVRADTLDRFSERFGPAGFRRAAFYPCYGMAEGTLFISGIEQGQPPHYKPVSPEALARGHSKASGNEGDLRLVGCGFSRFGTEIAIVDPEQGKPLEDGRIGEIWVSGTAVAEGYHGKPELSAATFAASLPHRPGRRFLRTGDLGFVHQGQLYVTGRLKDLLIVRGRNLYPQDLEDCAQRSNPWLSPNGGAAVDLDPLQAEGRIALIHELSREGWRRADPIRVSEDIRAAIAGEFGLALAQVVLIRPGSLPRTSSGKVRRTVCRRMVLDGGFAVLDSSSRQTEAVQ